MNSTQRMGYIYRNRAKATERCSNNPTEFFRENGTSHKICVLGKFKTSNTVMMGIDGTAEEVDCCLHRNL